MARNHQRVPLLLLLLLSSSYLFIVEATQHNEITIESRFVELLQRVSKQDTKISEIESRGKEQDQDISILKATVSEDKNEITFLKNRVTLLEASTDRDDEALHDEGLVKRPARLLPISAPYTRFYGPPNNCSELVKLGYTLNGYYLTKSSNSQGLLGVVYCRFHQPNVVAEKQNFETFIGELRLKTSKNFIHFQVARSSKSNKGNNDNGSYSTLGFESERLNIGQAMNLKTGIFTAPVTGIYRFQFTGLKIGSIKDELFVYLMVNKKSVSLCYADKGSIHIPLSMAASLRLKANDQVYLSSNNNGTKLFDGDNSYTHFSGWLVEDES